MRPLIIISFVAVLSPMGCSDSKLPRLSVDFTWLNDQRCYDERSPEIVIENVPGNTKRLEIDMLELDSRHEHGGGSFPYNGTNLIPEGALDQYRGPCPSYGVPRYELTVKAVDEGGKVVALGKKMRKWPPEVE